MRRRGAALTLALPLAAAMAGCNAEAVAPARYAGDECRRLTIIDERSGDHLRGVEDMALDVSTGRLFMSAYDRRAVEKAARRKAPALPQGGVYAVSVDRLFDEEAEAVVAAPLVAPGEIAGGLRPHGLSYDAANQEIVFINRAYQKLHGRWVETPHLQRIGANGEMFVGETQAAPCSANDVLVTNQQILTSFDHGACGWRATLEDVFKLKRSGLASNHGGSVFDNAAFANGVTHTAEGLIALAATRENALVLLKEFSGKLEQSARVSLPGGPDNLSISYDGGVVAATHPSLWRLALNRKLGIGTAPSRVVKVDPDTGAVEVLYDDPAGKQFSAATIAVETPAGLVAGSVTDRGVLVCRAGD
ncbi:MAG: hypothetical protein ACX939_09645 [Hyphococcus sp.]